MDDQPVIRETKQGDLPKLLELYKHLHPEDAPLPPRPDLESIWEEMCRNTLIHCIVSELDSKLISSCILVVIPNLTRGARPYALVENVVAHSDYRRQGHAEAVLTYAKEIAASLNCYKVVLLSSKARDKAHQLYEKVGFEKESKYGYLLKM